MAGVQLIPMHFDTHEIHVVFDTHGNPWWPAAEPCEILGLGNVRMAVSRLDDDEKRLITIPTSGGPQRVWCINEAGLYNLMLSSRKPQAKAFRRWLTHDVLPTLRKTGHYELTSEKFFANVRRPIQVQNSRDVGALQSAFGGKGDAIKWYRKSSRHITGKYPKMWCNMAIQRDLHGEARRRGREAVRVLFPEGACAMSLSDELVLNNINEAEAIAIGKDSIALFKRIIDAGVIPAELHDSPLEANGEDEQS